MLFRTKSLNENQKYPDTVNKQPKRHSTRLIRDQKLSCSRKSNYMLLRVRNFNCEECKKIFVCNMTRHEVEDLTWHFCTSTHHYTWNFELFPQQKFVFICFHFKNLALLLMTKLISRLCHISLIKTWNDNFIHSSNFLFAARLLLQEANLTFKIFPRKELSKDKRETW